jgi:hypothetical protein
MAEQAMKSFGEQGEPARGGDLDGLMKELEGRHEITYVPFGHAGPRAQQTVRCDHHRLHRSLHFLKGR